MAVQRVEEVSFDQLRKLYNNVHNISPMNLDGWLQWIDGGEFFRNIELDFDEAVDNIIKFPWEIKLCLGSTTVYCTRLLPGGFSVRI